MSGKKALKYLGYLLCLVLVYFIINGCIAVFNNRPVSVLGYYISYVPTDSMETTIPKQTYILVCENEEVGYNDVIVYKSKVGQTNGKYIVHRIVKETNDGFICKGDNNITEDEEVVTKDMIYGKYIKNLDFITGILGGKNRSMMFIIIIIVFALMFVLQTVNIIVNYKNEKTKIDQKQNLEDLKKQIYKEELLKMLKEEQKKES